MPGQSRLGRSRTAAVAPAAAQSGIAKPSGADPRRALGAFGESAVAQWYVARGAKMLDRNWRVREGEIDLVVAERGALVVVEVKTRRSTKFGLPIEAITPAKAARLHRLTGLWVSAHPAVRYRTLRIDIASVLVDPFGRPHVEVVTLDV